MLKLESTISISLPASIPASILPGHPMNKITGSQQQLSLLSSVCKETYLGSTSDQVLIEETLQKAAMPPEEERMLKEILESHLKVCTHRPG